MWLCIHVLRIHYTDGADLQHLPNLDSSLGSSQAKPLAHGLSWLPAWLEFWQAWASTSQAQAPGLQAKPSLASLGLRYLQSEKMSVELVCSILKVIWLTTYLCEVHHRHIWGEPERDRRLMRMASSRWVFGVISSVTRLTSAIFVLQSHCLPSGGWKN